MVVPNTNPVVSDRSRVEFLKQRSANLPVNIHPIGSVTQNADGKELAEMYDMHAGGAVAFSDGKKSIQQPGMLLKGLQYLSAKKAVLIQVPNEESISSGGLMNEGIMSTRLGLPGNPAIAEELMIARDIALLEYTDSALHITGVSTKKGLDIIRAAKKQGLRISCSATPYHLYSSDEDLAGYDTNYKVNPPLRTPRDMEAIREGFRAGDIDCVASHHSPQCWDDKTCEFEYAKNGMITLQNVYSMVNAIGSETENIINILTINPRKIFSVEIPEIKEGAAACLTLFEPETEFIFEEAMILSKSKNSPYIGKTMKGKVIGIINKNKKELFR
ncbi:MAG: dihydroorotase [Ferruginibacter sp.]